MRQLLWKEWHEQSWKLGFGGLVLGALAMLAFHARLLADETTAMWICTIGMTLLPLLASTGLIPAERETLFQSVVKRPQHTCRLSGAGSIKLLSEGSLRRRKQTLL